MDDKRVLVAAAGWWILSVPNTPMHGNWPRSQAPSLACMGTWVSHSSVSTSLPPVATILPSLLMLQMAGAAYWGGGGRRTARTPAEPAPK